jgi:hypothetical protein
MRASWLLPVMIALAPSRVSVDVRPHAVIAGGAVRVTCTVPRNADNRMLEMAIPGYSRSEYPLNGDSAPITHARVMQHIPCGVDEVDCRIFTAGGQTFSAVTSLAVAGCDQ